MASVQDVTVLLRLRDDLSRKLARVEADIARTTSTMGRLGTAGQTLGRQFSGVNSTLSSMSSGLLNLGQQATVSAAKGFGFLTAAIGVFGIKSAASFEQSKIAFGTLLESADKGKALFSELQQFNIESPFNLTNIAAATQTLLQFGFTGDNVVATLKSIANVAALSGPQADDNLGRIALALGQIRSAGVLRAQDLNQLVQAGFPAYALLTQVTGQTTAELRKQMESGLTLPAQDYIDALNKGTGVLAKYQSGALQMSNTLKGQWSSLRDAAQVTLADAFAPLSHSLVSTMAGLRTKLPTIVGQIAPGVSKLLTGLVNGAVAALPGALKVLAALFDGINRLMDAAKPALVGMAPLSDQLATGIGKFVDKLVPVMPDLAAGFIGLVRVLPDLVTMLGDLILLTKPLLDFGAQLLGMEGGRQVMAGLLVALLGYRALVGIVGPIIAASKALWGLAAAQSAAGAAGGAGRLGGLGKVGAGLGIVGGGAGIVASSASASGNGLSAGNLLGGAASGALLGASVGSVVPGVGTAVGAVAGGAAGSIAVLAGDIIHRRSAAAPPSGHKTEIGQVNVYNPQTDVDVIRAIDEAQRRQQVRQSERGY